MNHLQNDNDPVTCHLFALQVLVTQIPTLTKGTLFQDVYDRLSTKL